MSTDEIKRIDGEFVSLIVEVVGTHQRIRVMDPTQITQMLGDRWREISDTTDADGTRTRVYERPPRVKPVAAPRARPQWPPIGR
jgi:hypothetical protein